MDEAAHIYRFLLFLLIPLLILFIAIKVMDARWEREWLRKHPGKTSADFRRYVNRLDGATVGMGVGDD